MQKKKKNVVTFVNIVQYKNGFNETDSKEWIFPFSRVNISSELFFRGIILFTIRIIIIIFLPNLLPTIPE